MKTKIANQTGPVATEITTTFFGYGDGLYTNAADLYRAKRVQPDDAEPFIVAGPPPRSAWRIDHGTTLHVSLDGALKGFDAGGSRMVGWRLAKNGRSYKVVTIMETQESARWSDAWGT